MRIKREDEIIPSMTPAAKRSQKKKPSPPAPVFVVPVVPPTIPAASAVPAQESAFIQLLRDRWVWVALVTVSVPTFLLIQWMKVTIIAGMRDGSSLLPLLGSVGILYLLYLPLGLRPLRARFRFMLVTISAITPFVTIALLLQRIYILALAIATPLYLASWGPILVWKAMIPTLYFPKYFYLLRVLIVAAESFVFLWTIAHAPTLPTRTLRVSFLFHLFVILLAGLSYLYLAPLIKI